MRKLFLIILVIIGYTHAQQTKFFRTYSMGLFDVGETVIPINDTNYIVAGTTNTTGMNGTDVLLFKTNSKGDVMWWKSIGGEGIQSGKSAVMATDSNGFLITGFKNNFDSTGYDVWVIKTNLTGDTTWTKSYGGLDWEVGHSINKLSDSTYIIVGETFSFGNGQRDVYVIHIDDVGDTLWTKTFGGSANDVGKYVYVDPADNILVIGNTESFGAGNSDVYALYLQNNGDTIWTRTIGTADDDFGYSADLYADTSGEMSFVIGYTSYYAPDLAQNAYILRVDSSNGTSISLHPQLESNAEILDHIKIRQSAPGKHYYTADIKYAYDEIGIVYNQKTSYNISYNGLGTYASGGNEKTMPNDIYITLDKGYIVTGYSENWGPGPTSCFLLKTDSLLIGPNTPVVNTENTMDDIISIFPNPVLGDYFYINASCDIQLVNIYNMAGMLIKSLNIGNASKSITVEKPIVSSGIYLVECITSSGKVNKLIVF